MMKRIVSAGVILGSVIVIAHNSLGSAIAVAGWLSASENASIYGSTTFLDRGVSAEVESLQPLSTADRAVVFVFSPQCAVCSANMANWTDMIIELKRAGIPMLAVAPVDVDRVAEYWRGFDASVPLVTAHPDDIMAALGVGATPATLVIRRGQLRAMALGVLSEPTQRQILDLAVLQH